MAGILGLHGKGEPSNCEKAFAALDRGRRTAGPVERSIGTHELISARFGEDHKAP
jgi:hypothetical protein